MINRFTLQFKDQRLEEKYQEFQLEHKRKPLAKMIIILTFIIVIIQGFFAILWDQKAELYKTIGYLIGDSCFLYIFIKKTKLIRWGLILISLLFLFSYIEVGQAENQFHYQLTSVLIFALQLVIINTGEFLDVLLQIVPIFLIYFLYYVLYAKNLSYSIITSVFMIGFLLLNSFYTNAQADRSKFQLTLIESQWDQILISSITQPSIIFSLDLIKNYFLLKKQISFIYECNSTEQLKQFLRISKIFQNDSLTLEKFIYQKIHSCKNITDQLINQSLFISYKKSIQEIKYSIFPGASPIILIQAKGQQDKFNERIEKLYQYKYLSLLKTLKMKMKIIYSKKKKDFGEIFKLLLYKDLIENSQKLHQVQRFNLMLIFKKLRAIYKNKQIKVVGHDLNIDVICFRNVLILVLIEILESTISNKVLIIINLSAVKSQIKFQVLSSFTQKTLENLKLRSQKFSNQTQIKVQEECKNQNNVEISFEMKNNISEPEGIAFSFRETN